MLRKVTLTLLLVFGTVLVPTDGLRAGITAQADPSPVHVVYHLDADSKGTTSALHQMKNQLAADPAAKIVVVAIGRSVPFLIRGSETDGGYPFVLMIEELQQSGVRFEACGNTVAALKVNRNQLDGGVLVVPSGMAELARLQSREGYAYIKP